MRKLFSAIIDNCPNFYVIGKARNGVDALEKIEKLHPALVLMDIEMPQMNGLETLAEIMTRNPLPVVMITNDAEKAVEASALGAVDFVIKQPLIEGEDEAERLHFYERLNVAVHASIKNRKLPAIPPAPTPIIHDKTNKELVIIGSSTGGPAALQIILTQIPPTIGVPVLIIQHMPPGFTRHLAARFDTLCAVTVKEAEHNEVMKAGTVYIAPSGIQTTIQKNKSGEYVIRQKIATTIETLYKPSIDVTLLSVASLAQHKLLAIILTGMGDDGLRGCKAVKQFGGTIISEAAASCVIYGMPKVVYEAGLVDQQVLIEGVFKTMMAML